MDLVIAKVVDSIVTNCSFAGKEYMQCYFPRVSGYPYIGAAHGIIGVLYMIMKTLQIVPILSYNTSLKDKIKASLQHVIEDMTPSGSFTYLHGYPLDQGDSEAVHWCHGAPGAVPMFLLAHQMFKDQTYLDNALKCANCVWEFGLIKKGVGLCHGICGNAYALMSVYKATGEESWLRKAQRFLILAGSDEEVR